MSFLNLKLSPAKKAWQSFTSKLGKKLHKLHKPKAITKKAGKYQLNPPTKKANRRDHINRRKLLGSSSYYFPFKRRRSYLFSQRKNAPVYIDKLFREPAVADELVAEFPPRAKAVKFVDKQLLTVAESAGIVEERKGGEKGTCGLAAADEMWESLGFTSPQMRGIDERAEQFIASFRAEMEVQEIMAIDDTENVKW